MVALALNLVDLLRYTVSVPRPLSYDRYQLSKSEDSNEMFMTVFIGKTKIQIRW
jgi:hypothetical protein